MPRFLVLSLSVITVIASPLVSPHLAADEPVPMVRPHAGMLRYPDVSQSQIVFVYAGDLWLVPVAAWQLRQEEQQACLGRHRG